MKLNVLSVCSQYSAEELLASSARAKAQSEFLNLQWEQGASIRDLELFLPELQRSVNENTITVVLDGSDNFYTKTLIAEGLDLELVPSMPSYEAVEEYCKPRGLDVSGRISEGTLLPRSAEPMNSSETVDQGFILIRGNCCIAVFPAGKKAFGDMFSTGLFPFLLRYGADTAVTQTIALRGSKVKDVEEYLRLFRYGKNILPLVYLDKGQPTLSITAIRKTEADSRQACESLLENIEAEMGAVVLTVGNQKKDAKLSRREAKKEKKQKKSKALQEIENYNPSEYEDKPMKEKKGFGLIRILLLLICICTFAVSAGYLGLRFYRSMTNMQDYDNLRQVYDNGGGVAPVGYPSDYDKAFTGLYQINQDVVGWLSIEGTSVDYPVVQYSDNDYYHRLNFEGESNLHGVPYVDYKVDMKSPSNNTIIYGHNVNKDDQMFNALIGYQKVDFYKEHPIINFHTVYGERQYKIFAAFVANVNPEHGEVFQYHNFTDADSVADMQEFIYNVQIRSMLNTSVDVLPSDELLTLSTCTYEFDNARFVVVARRVRDGESTAVDTSSASKNTNALMPGIWYELYGGTKPVLQAPTFEDTVVLSNQDKVPSTKAEETLPTTSTNVQTAAPQTPVVEQAPAVQEKLLEKASISSAAATMTAGTTMNLQSIVEPVLENVSYTWSSSNTAVATVDTNGVVTAVGQGQVQINLTVTNGNKTENTIKAAPLSLTITAPQPAENVLADGKEANSLEMTVGMTYSPTVSGSTAYTWTSGNKEIATVSNDGQITALKEGSTTITVTGAKGDKAEIALTVKAKPEVILLNNKENMNLELTVGMTYSPTISGSTAYTWASSNKEIATVSSDGQIVALKEGSATITVTGAKGDKAEIALTVKAKPEVILLNGSDELSVDLTAGDTYSVTASGSTAYTWKSDDEAVATVDQNGKITAVSKGIAFITATGAKGSSAEMVVTVAAKAETVLLDGKSALNLELKVDESYTPTASGSTSYKWTSSNEAVADVSSKGKIVAFAEGTATITVTGANGSTAKINLTVVKAAASGSGSSGGSSSGSGSSNNSSNSNDKLTVKINGSTVTGSALDIVCQMVQAEMGTSFHTEALKAQAVAAYTYVKYNNTQGIKPSVAAKTPISANVKQAVQDVIGEAVYYNGAYINATYCAANAGVSNNCVDVWGGNLPYLVSVDSEGDESTIHYGYQTRLSLDYVADRIEDYHSTDPWDYSSDPDDWFGRVTYGAGKYVNTVQLCGSSIKGRLVREGLLQSKIRSAAFEVEYDASAKEFVFTTYGYGHGVGMSQLGANYYAKQGWSYVDILEHYYSGAVVK